jgi:outer membrane protein OmpA-like peptidoglycan-associated protein
MIKRILSITMLLGLAATLPAQDELRTQPKFWLGVSGAANYNMYTGTTQTLNPTLMAPAAFHEGSGVGGFASLLLEYRPIPVVGLMLNVGYDGRGGAFNQVISPCNCPEDLKTGLSYATIQPSIRISPFGPNFYAFLGGAYNYNLNKSFAYTFDQNNGNLFNTSEGEFSNVRQHVFSTHIGLGYDIQLSAWNSATQVALSPFISYHPYFGQAPRDIESWSLSTVRIGLALKFGTGKVNEKAPEKLASPLVEKKPAVTPSAVVPVTNDNEALAATDKDVTFTVRAPLTVPVKRKINEAFPLRNYVFFEAGSTEIPKRYIRMTTAQAAAFELEQLRTGDPKDQVGRSARQMKVYYNIINIVGYRLGQNPTVLITLTGSSAGDGPEMGKEYAESVKRYLVDVFGIRPIRITTEGRNQPLHPSELPGGKNYLTMLREGDRRVDITATSTQLLLPLQIDVVQADPLDSRILFNVKSDKKQALTSWNVEATDEKGVTQHYGPYTRNQESISGNTILGGNQKGKYKFIVTGRTPSGLIIRKESTIDLIRNEEPKEEALRFSILFDFDEPRVVENYKNFLIEEVATHIANNGKVIIHGHTDIVGSNEYNMNLSEQRATDIMEILQKATFDAGKTGVVFDVIAFGMDAENAPFGNKLPEERFYNRTVIIDIVQPK